VLNGLGMSEGSILNVLRTDGFGILNLFHLGGSFFQKNARKRDGK
jgi:hypothetical protein